MPWNFLSIHNMRTFLKNQYCYCSTPLQNAEICLNNMFLKFYAHKCQLLNFPTLFSFFFHSFNTFLIQDNFYRRIKYVYSSHTIILYPLLVFSTSLSQNYSTNIYYLIQWICNNTTHRWWHFYCMTENKYYGENDWNAYMQSTQKYAQHTIQWTSYLIRLSHLIVKHEWMVCYSQWSIDITAWVYW